MPPPSPREHAPACPARAVIYTLLRHARAASHDDAARLAQARLEAATARPLENAE